MKRILALLLAISMLAMLCACSSNNSDPQQTTAAQNEAQNDAAEESTAAEVDLAAVVADILGDAISMDDYEVSVDEEYVSLYLLEDMDAELDYTIDLDDGTTLTLPLVYSELLAEGWTPQLQWEEEAKPNTLGSATHTNEDGNTIYVSIINPTNETMKVEDIWVNQVTVGNDYTEGFDIHGIHAGSTIADVVAAFGNPNSIYFYYDGEYTSMKLEYADASYCSLTFRIDVETSLITGATYYISKDQIG